jgi:predicted RNA-binding Zn-ribbon protein involved in translation (DUF1610 family)
MWEVIPNEQSFMEKVLGHDCGDRDIVSSDNSVRLTMDWRCLHCGWEGRIRLSAAREGKFEDWIRTREGRIRMTLKTTGVLVIDDEVEL